MQIITSEQLFVLIAFYVFSVQSKSDRIVDTITT